MTPKGAAGAAPWISGRSIGCSAREVNHIGACSKRSNTAAASLKAPDKAYVALMGASRETTALGKNDGERGGKRQKRGNRLYLLRHAKAVLGGEGVEDMPRALVERGHEQMRALTAHLAAKTFAPDLVLVSPSQRTRETLEWLRALPATIHVVFSDKLYHATSDEVLTLLRGLEDSVRKALVVGHNPGLHDLAVALLSPDSLIDKPKASARLLRGFPTASLAEFEFAGPWSGLAAGAGQLRRFVRPKDLLTAAS